jgi:hypothetical protein
LDTEKPPPVGRGGGFGDTVQHGGIDVGVGFPRRQHHRNRIAYRNRRARFGDQPAQDPVHFRDVAAGGAGGVEH